ncbi:mitochondrial carnitine/acylcarnitine carrier protein [Rhizodiscina lignyota]|uniref:Mitochondrial carnitine/acylcarnitine carrier protein n=1 Tax=Rhizodiscina lignyota TaxID=1504668 RepID=A0A9P4M9G2_9PEZI|nr:mitochondrial carnitine/acylcarnitine carrier protein [Rhizodiscina lignyota]
MAGVKAKSEPELPAITNYKGFVAGVFSGIAKLSVGHPFDTIKVRLQTSEKSQFRGPLDCVLQTVRKEGVRGLYKGATPPLIGWMFMDSLMLGSLTVYRGLLNDNFFNPLHAPRPTANAGDRKMPAVGHGIAGMMAGWTVSFIAAPFEHVKARLQIQYAADKSKRLYSGPIDCTRKLLRSHGVSGLFHGLFATLIFRTFFFFWWSSYDLLTRALSTHTSLSTPAVNFWAGGLSAQVFWITSYPSDVVKQRIMTDPLGPDRKFKRWSDAARTVWRESGWRGYWRGFTPCFLRAFPANAMALVAFEGVMRALG